MNRKLLHLTNPIFILSLAVLLANDFYFKYEFHNWITGKLSDVAGLFVFAYFFSSLFPNHKKVIYILTALGFVYWKSPYSQTFINFFSENIYLIDRTVDWSDLLALFVLPFAYHVTHDADFRLKIHPVPIAILAFFSFCATSVPQPRQVFELPEYVLFKPIDIDVEYYYGHEMKVHDLDSMIVVEVRSIETERFPALNDTYHESLVLADLDLRILRASNKTYGSFSDLSLFQHLRDSLTIKNNTSVTLYLSVMSDELNFTGTRLNGSFKRYSDKEQLLIDGRYKNGIPDSTWTFFSDIDGTVMSRRYFVGGELVKVETIRNEQVISNAVPTRQQSITKEYWVLSIIGALSVLIIVRLFLNFRNWGDGGVGRMSAASIILLPTFTFIVADVVAELISESSSDLFKWIGRFILTNIILIPFLIAIHYWIKLRSKHDLLLYILLFILVGIWIREFYFLKAILI